VDSGERQLVVLDPTSMPLVQQRGLARRPATLEGKVLGLLDNGKYNAEIMLAFIAEELTARHSLAGIRWWKKEANSQPAPAPLLQEIAQQCDLVLIGVGD